MSVSPSELSLHGAIGIALLRMMLTTDNSEPLGKNAPDILSWFVIGHAAD